LFALTDATSNDGFAATGGACAKAGAGLESCATNAKAAADTTTCNARLLIPMIVSTGAKKFHA